MSPGKWSFTLGAVSRQTSIKLSSRRTPVLKANGSFLLLDTPPCQISSGFCLPAHYKSSVHQQLVKTHMDLPNIFFTPVSRLYNQPGYVMISKNKKRKVMCSSLLLFCHVDRMTPASLQPQLQQQLFGSISLYGSLQSFVLAPDLFTKVCLQ